MDLLEPFDKESLLLGAVRTINPLNLIYCIALIAPTWLTDRSSLALGKTERRFLFWCFMGNVSSFCIKHLLKHCTTEKCLCQLLYVVFIATIQIIIYLRTLLFYIKTIVIDTTYIFNIF